MALHFLTEEASAAVGEDLVLSGAEAHHAIVRRVREGEGVTVGDGAGTWLAGTVAVVKPKEVVVRVTSVAFQPSPRPRLVLAQALAKGDRDELAVQAATEIGVDEILPWQAARSVSRWSDDKAAKGVARWQAIAREASKQAHRAWVPSIATPKSTAEIAARPGMLLVLEPAASARLSQVELPTEGDIVVIVGPEGGVASEELAELERAGASCVRLGDTVLRTSTAGPAALALTSARLGRW
ncbi:16S rRNA (uracil(1498)-N(3))-methyltransferase [Microbacterium sp.]|uniref:16S rRNA (uracil(1498)-N(3))-methyltransferase n=1 Tax=Microbacterium sp. TaxID=51671 RepID=UPI0025D76796|nr:16S rRNA (uracil(1498)-N(3))-methyltransferase [Microbacterium sp.]